MVKLSTDAESVELCRSTCYTLVVVIYRSSEQILNSVSCSPSLANIVICTLTVLGNSPAVNGSTLRISPSHVILERPDATQQIVIDREQEGGRRSDITRDVTFHVILRISPLSTIEDLFTRVLTVRERLSSSRMESGNRFRSVCDACKIRCPFHFASR